jgi:hypothetical protein
MLYQVLEVFELLDSKYINGQKVADFLMRRGLEKIEVQRMGENAGSTDFIKIIVPGTNGKQKGGEAPTLGIIGRLGGIGARPERIGIVSDADGAVAAISCALKLADMQKNGDILNGDVILSTQICPNAPTQPHEPVPFMGSPVDMETMNRSEVDSNMDAILSIDATKGNRIINFRGFAITPTIKEGYILRISEDLLNIMEWTTGRFPRVVPITTQDITPYGNGLFHVNSIVQPCVTTIAPVVGIAVTTEMPVSGCSTGANHEIDVEEASRYCIEVAKAFTEGKCNFYNNKEFKHILKLYGSMKNLQTLGGVDESSDCSYSQ